MIPGELPQLQKRVTQEQVERYAQASGDFNPLHTDPEYAAATTSYGRNIAHGMLVMAFLSEMMAAAFLDAWLSGGKLQARFRAPVYPGDTVTTFGAIKSQREAGETVHLEYIVGCRNQDGGEVVTGEATVDVPFSAVER
ncbi:MAG: hypothetical protein EXR55_07155 [Dehalococcoidia bacterium]|nr:hypothetical protein [Dehalococcoidia bacterium]